MSMRPIRMLALRRADQAEQRGDPLPEIPHQDPELIAMVHLFEVMRSVPPSRRVEVLDYVIGRLELRTELARFLVPRLPEEPEQQ